jgi:hypothetical protein
MSEGPALVDFGLDGDLNIFRGKESQTKFIGLIRSVGLTGLIWSCAGDTGSYKRRM